MKRAIQNAAWAAFLMWCVVETCIAMLRGRSARELAEDVQ